MLTMEVYRSNGLDMVKKSTLEIYQYILLKKLDKYYFIYESFWVIKINQLLNFKKFDSF